MTEPAHQDRAHSELGASGCKRWWNCGGSVALSRGIPNRSSVYAAEGTAAHELAEACLTREQDAVEYIDRSFGDFTVTSDMAEAVQVYLDECRRVPGSQHIEVRFSLESIDPPAPMFGTADFVLYDATTRTLRVVDLKYGAGVQVQAEDNPQLRYYALGAMLAFPQYDVQAIEAVIVQPRAFGHPIRSTTIDPVDLWEWSVTLIRQAEKALAPDALLKAGDWCRFCPAAGKCSAQRDAALAVAVDEFAVEDETTVEVVQQPIDARLLTPEQVADALARVPMVEAFIRDLLAVGHQLATQGTLPGWKLVPKRPTQRWTDATEAADMLAMAHELPDDAIFKPRELVSPAQAREALTAQILASRLAGYAPNQGVKKSTKKQAEEDARKALGGLITSASSGENLVPVSDERLALPAAGAEFDALPAS